MDDVVAVAEDGQLRDLSIFTGYTDLLGELKNRVMTAGVKAL